MSESRNLGSEVVVRGESISTTRLPPPDHSRGPDGISCDVPSNVSLLLGLVLILLAVGSAAQVALNVSNGLLLSGSTIAAILSVILLTVIADVILIGWKVFGKRQAEVQASERGISGGFFSSRDYVGGAGGHFRVRSPLLRVRLGDLDEPNLIPWIRLAIRIQGRSQGFRPARLAFLGSTRGWFGNQLVFGRITMLLADEQISHFATLALKSGGHVHVKLRWVPGWAGPVRSCPLVRQGTSSNSEICLPQTAGVSDLRSWFHS
jgi:hypothetical protein